MHLKDQSEDNMKCQVDSKESAAYPRFSTHDFVLR